MMVQVISADDCCIGDHAEFLKRVDAEIASVTDERVRAKLT